MPAVGKKLELQAIRPLGDQTLSKPLAASPIISMRSLINYLYFMFYNTVLQHIIVLRVIRTW